MRYLSRRTFLFTRVSLVISLSILCANMFAVPPSQIISGAQYFIDCSALTNGDGSASHPWNMLSSAEAHVFQPGDSLALRRGTVCHGAFAPHGSGADGAYIRLTAYGSGARPRIEAAPADRQALLLFNQEYWKVDSLDLSGGSTYGLFVTGDRGPLRHIILRNLYVHDVAGAAMTNKDNGLIVVGSSARDAVFEDVSIESVDTAHTRMWSGILVGGGSFPYPDDAPLNRRIEIRNSTASDVYGDGIVLFRVGDGKIASSAAWQTGMQPTETIGTPNAIWTWTCTHCTVEDSEAFLTDSPGIDGGAYDIDWNDHDNAVIRNFAHDTQGYCVAVFGAGYQTTDSRVEGNLCVDNGLSPRLAKLQGAIYIHVWNGGIIRNLELTRNTIQWSPSIPDAAAIVSDATQASTAPVIANNTIVSSSPWIYRIAGAITGGSNTIRSDAEPRFTVAGAEAQTLAVLQQRGLEKGSTVEPISGDEPVKHALRMEATVVPSLDADGLLTPEVRGQLLVLRSLARQYSSNRLRIIVHLSGDSQSDAMRNALGDMMAASPGAIEFNEADGRTAIGYLRLLSSEGALLQEWSGAQNAAELGGAVREKLGKPDYLPLQRSISTGGYQ